MTTVQNYFIGQVNKSLVCTISLDICNLLAMWSCCPKHKWNYESVIKYIIFNHPLPSPAGSRSWLYIWNERSERSLWKQQSIPYCLKKKRKEKEKSSYEVFLNGVSERRPKEPLLWASFPSILWWILMKTEYSLRE